LGERLFSDEDSHITIQEAQNTILSIRAELSHSEKHPRIVKRVFKPSTHDLGVGERLVYFADRLNMWNTVSTKKAQYVACR
jgi:hypothetical protein